MTRRVMVVGGGAWGVRVARKLEQVDGLMLVAIVEPCAERRAVLRGCGLPVASRIDDVMASSAIVATPPATHASVVDALARRGYDTIRVEKPCGTSPYDAQRMAAWGAEVTCGYQMLHSRGWRILRAWTCTARVWDVEIIRTCARRPRHDTTAMLDLGSHGAAYAADLPALPDHAYTSRRVRIVALHDAAPCRSLRLSGETDTATLVEHADGAQTLDINGVQIDVADDSPLRASLEAWRDGDGYPIEFAARVHEVLAASSALAVAS